jgi:hypothetical protein
MKEYDKAVKLVDEFAKKGSSIFIETSSLHKVDAPSDQVVMPDGRIMHRLLSTKEVAGRIKELQSSARKENLITEEGYTELIKIANDVGIKDASSLNRIAREALGLSKMKADSLRSITKAEAEVLKNALHNIESIETPFLVEVGDKKLKTQLDIRDYSEISSLEDMKSHGWASWVRSLKNPMRTLREFKGQSRNALTRLFHEPITVANGQMKKEYNAYVAENNRKEKEYGIGRAEWYRVQVKMLADQPESLEALKKQGIDPTKIELTPNEEAYKNHVLDTLMPFLQRFNDARATAGRPPVKPAGGPLRGLYFPFIRDMVLAERNGTHLAEASSNDIVGFKKGGYFDTTNKYTKRVKKSELPFLMDGKMVYEDYLKTMLKYIHMTPVLAKQRSIVRQLRNEHKIPVLRDYLSKSIDFYSGKKITDLQWQGLQDVCMKLNENILYGVLSYNFRSALIQMSSLRNTIVACGLNNTMGGIADWFTGVEGMGAKESRAWAQKLSDVLVTRTPEVSIEDIQNRQRRARAFQSTVPSPEVLQRAIGKLTSKSPYLNPTTLKELIGKAGIWPLAQLDKITAEMTYFTAKRHAAELGITGENNIKRYCDDIVNQTQGSGNPDCVSPAQRTPVGKMITFLQTFTINNWGFITSDVLGMKNPKMDIRKAGGIDLVAEKALKLVMATMFFSYIYEDLGDGITNEFPQSKLAATAGHALQLFSPFPRPLKGLEKYNEEATKTKTGAITELMAGRQLTEAQQSAMTEGTAMSMARQARAMGGEIMEDVPVVGGAFRYGSSLGGPAMSMVQDALTAARGKPTKEPFAIGVAKLAGVPGVAQMWKSYKSTARAEEDRKKLLHKALSGRY